MPKKKELKIIREKIDELDAELLNLINKRSSLAKEAGETKKEEAIYKPEREAKILRKLKKANLGPLNEEQISNIFREINISLYDFKQNFRINKFEHCLNL